ncbi:MAG: C-GCAxxG-C-C family protein [Dehalococcoidales bacterium]|nr:C-GCAxxG-C-C family protein [Dehalococcoidales bacterium]
MKLKLSLQEAKDQVAKRLMKEHCGPSVLKVMCQAYGIKDKDVLWAGTVFRGGIGGMQEAPCGAVSGAAIALGLRHRCSLQNKAEAEKAAQTACEEAAKYVKSFKKKFGAITCIGLLGVDFSDEAAVKKAREKGLLNGKCEKHVQFAIEKLFELEEKRNRSTGK